MADKFPSTFVDEKTGQVKRMESMLDKLEADVLPKAGKWGVIGAKTAMIGAMSGALPIVLPVAAAVYLYSKSKIKSVIDSQQDREDAAKGTGGGGGMGRLAMMLGGEEGYDEFDMNKDADRKKFVQIYGARHPSLPDDIVAMAKSVQLKELPVVRMTHSMFPGPDDYLCAATSRVDGSKPVVMIGRLAEKELTPGEMRAVIGHELTHVKLGHVKDRYNDISRSLLSKALSAGLIITGVVATLAAFTMATPFFAGVGALALMCAKVAGVVVGGGFVNKALDSIQSRRREDLCDQGAAILTGGTADLTSALGKIKGGMMKMHQREADMASMMRGGRGGKVREIGGFMRWLLASHPTAEHRAEKLKQFEENHKSYCENKRAEFKAAFNAAAAKPEAQAAAAVEARRKAQMKSDMGMGGLDDIFGMGPQDDPQLTLPGMGGASKKPRSLEDVLGQLFGGAAGKRGGAGAGLPGNDDADPNDPFRDLGGLDGDDPFAGQPLPGKMPGRVIVIRRGSPFGRR
ncbi:MAG: M48 family metalloprotease [Alphaproteobacteria bacterium]